MAFGKGVPSCLAEGMATCFEGFRKIGQRYEFGRPSEKRLASLRDGPPADWVDLEFVLTSDAARLISSRAGDSC